MSCEHDDLTFVAFVAAPGYGLSYACACGKAIWKAGPGDLPQPYDEMDRPPELSIDDII